MIRLISNIERITSKIPIIGGAIAFFLIDFVIGILAFPWWIKHLRGLLHTNHLMYEAIKHPVNDTSSGIPGISRLVAETTAMQSAFRHLRRDLLDGNGQAVNRPIESTRNSGAFRIDPQVRVVEEVAQRRAPIDTRNRLPRLSDWSVETPLSKMMSTLGEPHTIHRKMWEYAICVEGMKDMGLFTPDAKAIAVGAGSERPLYYFANTLDRMVATDLYDNPQHEGTPDMLSSPEKFAPFPYRHEKLEVYRMGGDALDFPTGAFDYAFCLSSIEHFGSREIQRKSFEEMIRVVKPGGGLCIITEVILNGEVHPEYFTPSEIHDMFLTNAHAKLDGGPIDLTITDAQIACIIDVRNPIDIRSGPHVLLTDGKVLWTSLSLFFRRI
ncbi:MAG: methyltransferase type [Beijerinckiaceae bacterium]|nr:MAG: methyltransferase type [Beijerinckiaceae bacterium]